MFTSNKVFTFASYIVIREEKALAIWEAKELKTDIGELQSIQQIRLFRLLYTVPMQGTIPLEYLCEGKTWDTQFAARPSPDARPSRNYTYHAMSATAQRLRDVCLALNSLVVEV